MTEERAVKIFKDMIRLIEQDGSDYVDARDIPMIELAIDALNDKIKKRTEPARFEEGKEYEWYQTEYGSIKVLKRTAKYIRVTNGENAWAMKIRTDQNGNEFVVDLTAPKKWQDAFTCSARWEAR